MDHEQSLDNPDNSNRGLLHKNYGIDILPQRAPTEVGVTVRTPYTTTEGFTVGGPNNTSLVGSLETLAGVELSTLEDDMHELSDSGFLLSNDSLKDILAADNETVLGMGLTHQKLADFLDYATAVSPPADRGRTPGHFEYNDKGFAASRINDRGYQESPFRDGEVTNSDFRLTSLQNGKTMLFSGLLPSMIGKYGFYEGPGVFYRVDPQELAEFGGFVATDTRDDPITELVQNPNTTVAITNLEQLHRAHNLETVGLKVLDNPGYKVAPADFATFLQFVSDAAPAEEHRSPDSRLAAHLDTSTIAPGSYSLAAHDIAVIFSGANRLPEIQPTILALVEAVRIQDEANNPYTYPIGSLLAQASEDATKGVENGYSFQLAQKVDLSDPTTFNLVYDQAAKVYGRKNFNHRNVDPEMLIKVIGQSMPSFADSAISYLRSLGAKVADDTSLDRLVGERDARIALEKAVTETIGFANDNGINIQNSQRDAVRVLLRSISAAKEQDNILSDEVRETIEELGVDPELIPFAIKSNSHYRPDELAVTGAQLFNGAAEELRRNEQTSQTLADVMDEDAISFIDQVRKQSFHDKPKELIASVIAKANALHQAHQAEGNTELVSTEVVYRLFASEIQPAFADLFQSDLVKITARNEFNVAFNVELQRDGDTFQAIEWTPLEHDLREKRVTLNGRTYHIGGYGIKDSEGNELRMNNSIITLTMPSI